MSDDRRKMRLDITEARIGIVQKTKTTLMDPHLQFDFRFRKRNPMSAGA